MPETQARRPDFTRDTAVTPAGDGAFTAVCSPAWEAPNGPNGGYLAAMVLRAMLAKLEDPARDARSLTLHYLRPPSRGPVRIPVQVERDGRTMSTLTARIEQGGRACVLATGVFGPAFPSVMDFTTPPPVVPSAAALPSGREDPAFPPIAHRFDARPAIGADAFSGADRSDTGGWLRLRDPAPVDAPLLALLLDAWLPAPFTVLTMPAFVPTIDLTIHFRNPAVAAAQAPEEPLLTRFVATTSHDGYFDEDGFVWAPDGTLLAQSRQLALLRPL